MSNPFLHKLDVMAKRDDSKITDQQKVLLYEYMKDFNISKAMIRAGYQTKYPGKMGYEIINRPHVKEELNKVLRKRLVKTQIVADRVLEGLADIAFSDLGDAFDDKGKLKNIKDYARSFEAGNQ